MGNRFKLVYIDQKNEPICGDARAWIGLRSFLKDKDGQILLSQDGSCIQEFEVSVNNLIKGLGEILKLARQRFAQTDQEFNDWKMQRLSVKPQKAVEIEDRE